jgi:hypothetical protein
LRDEVPGVAPAAAFAGIAAAAMPLTEMLAIARLLSLLLRDMEIDLIL